MDNLWSPVEILRSAWEFLLRAVLSWWTLLTGVIAGLAAVLEHVSPETHISDRLWLRIAVVGVAMSLVWAYHRTRMERQSAHANDVRGDHLQELQRRLQVLLTNVEREEGCNYEDPPDGRRTHHDAFRAHYPELEASLDVWDRTVKRVATARWSLMSELSGEVDQEEIKAPEYIVGDVLAAINGLVVTRAEKGELGQSAVVRGWDWGQPLPDPPGAPPTQAMWVVRLGQHRIALVPDLPEEGREDRLKATQQRIEALWKVAETWDVAAEIGASKEALAQLQQPLKDDLQEWQKVSGVRVSPRCSICRKNEQWEEPKPPLLFRIDGQIRRGWRWIWRRDDT